MDIDDDRDERDDRDDSDHSSGSDKEGSGSLSCNLTGFLFGNIDSNGRLVDDIFDSETNKQLGSLARLGLDNPLADVMREERADKVSTGSGGDQPRANGTAPEGTASSKNKSDSDSDDDGDYERKSETAIDYSDINELAEDLQSLMVVR